MSDEDADCDTEVDVGADRRQRRWQRDDGSSSDAAWEWINDEGKPCDAEPATGGTQPATGGKKRRAKRGAKGGGNDTPRDVEPGAGGEQRRATGGGQRGAKGGYKGSYKGGGGQRGAKGGYKGSYKGFGKGKGRFNGGGQKRPRGFEPATGGKGKPKGKWEERGPATGGEPVTVQLNPHPCGRDFVNHLGERVDRHGRLTRARGKKGSTSSRRLGEPPRRGAATGGDIDAIIVTVEGATGGAPGSSGSTSSQPQAATGSGQQPATGGDGRVRTPLLPFYRRFNRFNRGGAAGTVPAPPGLVPKWRPVPTPPPYPPTLNAGPVLGTVVPVTGTVSLVPRARPVTTPPTPSKAMPVTGTAAVALAVRRLQPDTSGD